MVHPGAGIAGGVMIGSAISLIAEVLTWLIVIDALLTFIPSIDRRNPIVKLIRGITEPIYRPLRKVIPSVRLGDAMLDLSPLIAIFGIRIIASILVRIIGA